jgi:transcriptional regulator with XRE-family HTH domain
MALISPIKLNIAERLKKDKNFRGRFFRGRAQDEIAMSIRGLREKRQMRQVDLSKASGMKQSAISRIEQADYSAWSFNTLFRVADALDARIRVIFEPIENVIEGYKEKEREATIASENVQCTTIYISTALEKEVSIKDISPPTRSDPSAHVGALSNMQYTQLSR